MKAFQSRYRTTCTPGDDEIKPGEWIVAHPEYGYAHEDCALADDGVISHPQNAAERSSDRDGTRVTMPRGKTTRDRCDRCFMVHSPGQDGCE